MARVRRLASVSVEVRGRENGGGNKCRCGSVVERAHLVGSATQEFRDARGEHIDQIFEPGFTTKDAAVGTGLGLTITAEIVRAHSADIGVTSELGKGATFVASLPALQS